MQYINFPILINIASNKNKKINVNFLIGLIVNKVINYSLTSYYADKPSLYENDIEFDNKLGLTLRLGANISKKISNHFNLNVVPFTDFKLLLNSVEYHRPGYIDVPDNSLSFGLKIGIEYLF